MYGTKGRLKAEPMLNYGGKRLSLHEGRNRAAVAYTPVDQFAAEKDRIADFILHDEPVLTPGEESLADMKVITVACEPVRTGSPAQV